MRRCNHGDDGPDALGGWSWSWRVSLSLLAAPWEACSSTWASQRHGGTHGSQGISSPATPPAMEEALKEATG